MNLSYYHKACMYRKFQTCPEQHFYFSALIKYTFIGFYGTLISQQIAKGGDHENRLGSRSTAKRWHFNPQIARRQIPHLFQRSCRSKENSNGRAGRTKQPDHRSNLPALPVQNQKILLRHSPLRSSKRHEIVAASKNRTQKRYQAKFRVGKTGYPTPADNQQKHVRNYTHAPSGRLFDKIAPRRPDIKRLWYQQKKITSKQVKERSRALLTPETIEVLGKVPGNILIHDLI